VLLVKVKPKIAPEEDRTSLLVPERQEKATVKEPENAGHID